MEYTANYHLPQWVESDRIMMEDFNEAMKNLDVEIMGVQTATDTAQQTADAISERAYTPDNMPYVVGTYRGNRNTQTIEVGFRPSFLIISGDEGSSSMVGHYQEYGDYVGIMSKDFTYDTVTLTDTGFQIVHNDDSYPKLNQTLQNYIYIAFR